MAVEPEMESGDQSPHDLIIDYCYSHRRSSLSGRMYKTSRIIFHDDPESVAAYKKSAEDCRDEYRAAKKALFDYAKIKPPYGPQVAEGG